MCSASSKPVISRILAASGSPGCLATLKFVEERIAHMIEIWGGIDAFGTYAVAAAAELDRVATLHSPKLDGEDGHATQDDCSPPAERLSLPSPAWGG